MIRPLKCLRAKRFLSSCLLLTALVFNCFSNTHAADQMWTGYRLYPHPSDPREWGVYVNGHWNDDITGYWPTFNQATHSECIEHYPGYAISDLATVNYINSGDNGDLFAHVTCDYRAGLAHSNVGFYFRKPCKDLGEVAIHFPNGSVFCVADPINPEKNLGGQCSSEPGEGPVGLGTNPINISTGNKFQRIQLLPGVPGRLPSISLFYNSSLLSNPTLPVSQNAVSNWLTTFSSSIRNESMIFRLVYADSDVIAASNGIEVESIVRLDDGKTIRFTNYFDSNSLSTKMLDWRPVRSDTRLRLVTVENEAGGFAGHQLVYPNGRRVNYDLTGKIIGLIDTNGMSLTFSYPIDSNRFSSITNQFGQQLLLTWNNYGISSIQNSAGAINNIEFDADGNLVAIIYPDLTPADPLDNSKKTLHYEDARFPSHLTRLSDERGIDAASWSYDGQGRAISSQRSNVEKYAISYGENSTTVTDPLSTQRTYGFSTKQGLSKVSDFAGGVCTHCNTGSAKRYNYDENGFLLSKLDVEGNETQYSRDAIGSEIVRTEAFGSPSQRTIRTERHANFPLKPSSVTRGGQATHYLYDENGRLQSKRIVNLTP